MVKMAAAVLCGQAIAQLPVWLVTAVSAGTFFTMALVIWFKRPETETMDLTRARSTFRIGLAAFASIFLSEWGDVGQLAAATMSARFDAPTLVWLGAVMAMVTKGVSAIGVGGILRRRVPQNLLRYVTFGLAATMGVLALFRVDL